MAVQAQYPSNAFSPDFRTNLLRTRTNVLDELQMMQDHHNLQSVYSGQFLQGFNNNNNNNNGGGGGLTVFSDPQSELTCNNNNNASGSRKRCRDVPILPQLPQSNNINNTSSQCFLPVSPSFCLPATGVMKTATITAVAADAAISTGQYNLSRLLESGATSTSGRPQASYSASQFVSPLAQDLVSHLYHQNLEIDALVRLQAERIRSGLDEMRKRHCRELLSVLEQHVVKRLKEKDTELENANRRNAELEEKVRQMTAENQIWFNVAKNNEAIVSSLRSSLEQVLLQNVAAANATAAHPTAKEGFGDSDCIANFPASDAQSCCFEEEDADGEMAKDVLCRKACKSCGEREVSVLLLPCRHLCLCKDCESKVDACPICRSAKNACLQVFMS